MATGVFGVLIGMVLTVIPAPYAVAATGINKQINFQGKVTNTNGTNVANGSYTFVFSLYTASSGGSAVWTETKSLTVTDGVFQTNLGSTTALPGSVDFNTDNIYLGMAFNSDPEMTPRIQLTAAAYAFNSDKLQGLGAAAFAQLSPGSAQSGSLNVTGSVQAATSLQAPLVDAATAVALNIGTGMASSVNIGRTTTPFLVQGNSSSTFTATSGANTTTVSFTAPTANRAINFPDAGGKLCTDTASTCSATYQVAGNYLAKNAADTSSFAVTAANYLYGFTNSSSAVASSVLKLDNGGNTGSGLTVVGSGNPAAGQALILANGATGITGKLLDLQVNASSKFAVDQAGAVTTGSTINGQTITSAASFTGTVTAATSLLAPLVDTATGITLNVGTGTATGLTLGKSSYQVSIPGGLTTNGSNIATANGSINAGSGTITSGAINGQTISATASFTGTVQAATSFIGTLFGTSNVASGTSSAVAIKSGDGTAGGASSGNVTIDTGSKNGAGFAGNVYVGNTNALNVNIGHNAATASGTAISIQGLAATSSFIFNDATNTNQTTIGFRAPTAANAIYFPNAGGDICTTVASTCNTTYQTYSSTGYLVKSPTANEASTSSFAAYQYSFTNNNAAASGVLNLAGAGTNSALSVTNSGNASAGQAVILATNTNGTPSGNLIDLRVTAGSKFSVDTAGAVLTSSTINGQTITSSASFSGTVTSANTITVSSGGIAVTGASTFSSTVGITGLTTTTGGITNNNAGIAAAGAISGATTITGNGTITGGGTFKTADTAAASTASAGVSLTSGNASGTGGTSNSGAVAIDSGTSTNGTTGAITVGTVNASAVTIGRAGATTSIQGNGSLIIQANNGANSTQVKFQSPTAVVDYTLQTNASNASAIICTSLAASCNTTYQPYLASGYLVKSPTSNEASSSNFTGYQYTFTQSSGTAAGNLSLANSGTNSALLVTVSSNPTAGQAAIAVNNTNGTPAGNLLDLQKGGTSQFAIDFAGNVSTLTGASSGKFNGQTISSTANFTGTVTAATGLTVTAGGASIGGNSSVTGTLGVSSTLTVSANGASITGGINNNAGGITGAGAVSGLSSLQYNTNGTIDTSASNSITIGGGNANAITIGKNTATQPTVSLQGGVGSVFAVTGGANSTTLAFGALSASGKTVTIPNETGTICTSAAGSTTCSSNYAIATGSANYIQNQIAAQQSSSNFWISATGRADTSLLTPTLDTATGVQLNIGTSGAPTTTAISLNQNTTVATGKSFTALGALTQSGGAVSIAGNAASSITTTSGNALTITSAAAATWSTGAGALNVTGGGGLVLGTANASGALTNDITIQTGNVTSGAFASGSVNIDAGTSTGTTGTVTVGGANASAVSIGRTGITDTLKGTTQIGASTGTGAFINNGATTNTEKNVADRNGGTGLSIGSAATTVDVYTYISVTQTTASQTITIPSPTANTVYGKLLYLSNVGTTSFVLLGATINPGATASLIWANTSGAASWEFAGADAGSLQTAYNNSATTDPQIQLSNANGGLKIRDAASSTIGNLLQVQNSGGTVTYLAVTSAATQVTGNILLTKEANRTIQVVDSTTAATAGGNLTVQAAAGNTSGAGGNLVLVAGAGGNAGVGGAASLTGGAGGGGNTAGGAVTVQGGAAAGTAAGGAVNINGGLAAATAGSLGGTITITAGAGTSTGTGAAGSAVAINGGAAGGSGNNAGGGVTITAGAATGTGTGGTLAMQGGAAAAVAASAGGSVTINAANGSNTGVGGNGGNITLVAGNGLGTGGNTNGGSIQFTAGTATGTGIPGVISIDTPVFTASSLQTYAVDTTVAASLVDSNSTILLTVSAPNKTISIPSPTNNTTGRIVYVTVASGSNTFTLAPSGGPTVNMTANSTAVLVWNGAQWTANSSANSLQQAYNNTSGTPASIITTSTTKNLLFQAGAGFDNAALLQVSNSNGANMISVDTTNTATTLNLMPNSGAETAAGFTTTYPATGFGSNATVSQDVTVGEFAAGTASAKVVITSGTTNNGLRANLGAALAISTIYNISFSVKTTTAWTNDIDVRYNRTGTTSDGATAVCSTSSASAGSTFSTRTVPTTAFTKVSCYITTSATIGDATANIAIFQTASAARTFFVDNIAVIAQNTTGTQDVGDLMVGGANGQGLTLLTLDSYANIPWTGTANTSLLGSMYYDTSVGLIKCYQATGWGTCGAAPNNNVFMIPEYGNAVLNGKPSGSDTNTGTMTANLCSGSAKLSLNTTICTGSTDDYNYYQWTSSQTNAQTYDIYVRYQLPPTFNNFLSDNTISAVARGTSTTDGAASMTLYLPSGTQCGSTTSLFSSANTWTTTALGGGGETACGFQAGDIMTFKIDMSAKNNANVFVSNISFTMTGK